MEALSNPKRGLCIRTTRSTTRVMFGAVQPQMARFGEYAVDTANRSFHPGLPCSFRACVRLNATMIPLPVLNRDRNPIPISMLRI
jgi:hypothetical protein